MKTALITGISGQDGSLLAEHLLAKNYKVSAITHHEMGKSDSKFGNYQSFLDDIKWKKIDLADKAGLDSFIKSTVPDEVYHLGAQSFPSTGFSGNFSNFQANTEGTYNLLASVFETNPLARFFFAGSSEIFGDNPNGLMNEEEKFLPKTMYGISKLVGHEFIRNYRDSLGRFAVTGFLFNHESPRRGEEFVTRKITLAAARIKLGLQHKLVLGSLDAKRDWSAAEDFIEGFHLALNAKSASDYVFASGKLHTIREFLNLAFSSLGLKYEDHLQINEAFSRPAKYDLAGDASKARNQLGWKPKYSLEQIVERMVKADYDRLKA